MYQSPLHPTLYTPATTVLEKLLQLANNQVRSVWRLVICTEDSVSNDELPDALANLRAVLAGLRPQSPVCVYVRARNPEVLSTVLQMPGAEKLTGFVVPKADPDTFPLYAGQIVGTPFKLMPILESTGMTDRHYREALQEVLSSEPFRGSIDCLRIGANDLMGHLGLRRDDKEHTVYSTPVGLTILEIINEFRGNGGFTITAPVFECFDSQFDGLLRKEVQLNILNGLYGQTVIHPRHLRIIRDMYKVTDDERASATSMLESQRAVAGYAGKMDEVSTHGKWAETILARHALFGNAGSSDAFATLLAS